MKNLARFEPGSAAPDFNVSDPSGKSVQISEFWSEKPIVVVFLRHLGCTFCRTHVLDLRKHYGEFKALGADIVCVAMGEPKLGKAFQVLFDLPFPVLMAGSDNTAPYELYGLAKGSFGQLLGLNSIINGFRAIPVLGNKLVGRIHGDGTQLAGTFVIDRGGIIRLAYRSKNAADNPTCKLLLDTIGSMHLGGAPHESSEFDRIGASAGQEVS